MRVPELRRFPLKSLQGERAESAELGRHGPDGDLPVGGTALRPGTVRAEDLLG